MAAPDHKGAIPSAAGLSPRKWKQIALAWAVVYPLVTALNLWVTPALDFIPQPIRGMIVVLIMASILTEVLPRANRRAVTWLSR